VETLRRFPAKSGHCFRFDAPAMQLQHTFPFDPAYGYSLERLLEVLPPAEPEGFADFWRARYERARALRPEPRLAKHAGVRDDFEIHDFTYPSTDGYTIGGWLLIPRQDAVRRGVVVGHGYGGRDAPDFDLAVADAAFLFPCFRGLSRSRCAGVSDNPAWHVLHDIDKRDRYILGGCVEDLWVAVSVLEGMFPEVSGHVGYMGISFGGGIGALAFPWDERIRMAHLNVPTFGHAPLRLTLPTQGSGESVRSFERRHGHVLDTLSYYDAASAAGHSRIPVHVAAAVFDPVVAPPGQFAIYNALPEPKRLFLLDAGHFEYPRQAEQVRALRDDLRTFFSAL
jgi:cephalosporin-C deacetylase